ncbi:unnamed protein product [Trichobilharzia regenti]|nr:unnamed protein product [Trichobilharzia regenti]
MDAFHNHTVIHGISMNYHLLNQQNQMKAIPRILKCVSIPH